MPVCLAVCNATGQRKLDALLSRVPRQVVQLHVIQQPL